MHLLDIAGDAGALFVIAPVQAVCVLTIADLWWPAQMLIAPHNKSAASPVVNHLRIRLSPKVIKLTRIEPIYSKGHIRTNHT
jgi:hypothetical protein